MLYGIALPPYELVKKFEGQGNWAVKKYYQFPFNIFYKKKFKMIIDMLTPGKIYRNILDYGGGPAEIFKKELGKHAMSVTSYNLPLIDSRWRFDVIILGSVLEFTKPAEVLQKLRGALAPKGLIIIASPMKNFFTDLYFKLVGDKNSRLSHQTMKYEIDIHFRILDYKTWLGLYFVCKAERR